MKTFYSAFHDVIFVDTTFSKNRFNMVMLDIVGVDQYGHNVLFGFALLNDSKEATFVWAFEHFQRIMEKSPKVVFSDQEQALVNSLHKVFPFARKFLCGWHIARNLDTYYRSKKGLRTEELAILRNLPFETDTGKFNEKVENLKLNEEIKNTKEYFERIISKSKQYAVCFIKDTFTSGINTTSRIESIHSQLSSSLTSCSSLQKVYDAFKDIERVEADKFEDELKIVKNPIPENPMLLNLSQTYSSYAIKKFIPNLNLVSSYKVDPSIDEIDNW